MTNDYVNDFNTTVQTYYKELKKCNPISREEEKELFKKIKNENSLSARNKILSSNLKFVFDIAKRYRGRGVSMEDLISEGNLGLTKAIDKFDVEKDIKFISYAVWWIRQYISDFIKKTNEKDNNEFSNDEQMNTKVKCNELFDEEDETFTFSEVVMSNEKEELEKELSKNRKIIIEKLLSKLPTNGQFIMKCYYGIGINKAMTLTEIGERLNLSAERVRILKKKYMRFLRSEIMLEENLSLVYH